MYYILLLHELEKQDCRVTDYLRLSGCNVEEGMLDQVSEYKKVIQRVDAVLLYCDEAELYFETCRSIRELIQMPVIILSKNDDEWVKIKMFQAGADDYLVEPFSQGELAARIQAHIMRYKRLTKPFGLIQVEKLEIDIFGRRVRLNGKEVFFRAKEFDVLLYLAQHAGKVVTKEEIYSAIWKDELGEGYYNAVAVHIKRVRDKIEEDPENPRLIETVWGAGYCFRG